MKKKKRERVERGWALYDPSYGGRIFANTFKPLKRLVWEEARRSNRVVEYQRHGYTVRRVEVRLANV